MLSFSLDYSRPATDPEATLRVSLDELDSALLSVAFRAARNRSALYQAKHAGQQAGLATRERDPALAALNPPISEHYRMLARRVPPGDALEDRRVIAFPISDLTANPLRPHYDASVAPGAGAFRSGEVNQALFGRGSDARLFHLEDEPLGDVPYTLLACYREDGRTRVAIHHGVAVRPDGSLPETIPADQRAGLLLWMACPPLLIAGQYREEEYALRDYDLRHLFGFADNFDKFGYPTKAAHEQALYEVFRTFPSWQDWCEAVRQKVRSSTMRETGYHAALGISPSELIVVHRIGTTREVAQELERLGARDAVLLDSGGSCAIWANWACGNQGGVLASAWNFRPPRGAVLFLVLTGRRNLPGAGAAPLRRPR